MKPTVERTGSSHLFDDYVTACVLKESRLGGALI